MALNAFIHKYDLKTDELDFHFEDKTLKKAIPYL